MESIIAQSAVRGFDSAAARRFAILMAISCHFATPTYSQNSPVPFLLEFGAEVGEEQGEYLSEAANGDIIVAGLGGSATGPANARSSPMLARVNRSGGLLWRRIYTELSDYEILGVYSDGDGDFVALHRQPRGTQSDQGRPYHEIELRRIGPGGDIFEVVRAVAMASVTGGHRYVDDIKDGVLFQGVTESAAQCLPDCPRMVSTTLLRANGPPQIDTWPDGYRVEQHMQNGELLLVTRDIGGATVPGAQAEIPWYDIAINRVGGEFDPLIRILSNSEFGSSGEIFATKERIFVFRLFPRQFNKPPAVTTFSLRGDLMADRPSGVRRISEFAETPEGGIVGLGTGDSPSRVETRLVFEVSPAGEVLWRGGFHPDQGIAFAFDIIVLRDGWIAVTGYAGPPAEVEYYYPHNRRQIFLLIAERSGESIAAPRNPERTKWFARPGPPNTTQRR